MLARVDAEAVVQPTIYITEADYERLSAMVGAAVHAPPGAALLRDELDRAVVVRPGELPTGFVKLGSLVRYHDRSNRTARTVQLVLPDAADIDENRISVFSPVGAALLGMTVDQEFLWEPEPGRVRILRILHVSDGDEAA